MNHRVGLLLRAFGLLLGTAAFSAQAFTLGDLLGTAVIGRALDVAVRFQSGPGEDISLNCIKAEVYFADARQTAPNVTLSAGTDNSSAVRIVSVGIVNEPVVTVLVRSTCGSSTMRRYVLLADFPSLAAVVQPPVAAASRASVSTPATAVSDASPMLVLPTPSEAAASTTVAQQNSPTDKRPTQTKDSSTTRTAKYRVNKPMPVASGRSESVMSKSVNKSADKAVKPSGKSLLKLDPLDFLSDRMDSLDSSMLFAPSEDALKQTQQIASLQSEVKLLRELAQKNDARMADLNQQLEKAQVPAYTVWLLYVLMALVILCLAAIAWLWNRQRTVREFEPSAWWNEGDDDEDHQSTLFLPQTGGPRAKAAVDKSAVSIRPVSAQKPAPASAASPVASSPVGPIPGLPEQSNPEELHDVDLDIDLGAFMMPETAPEVPLALVAEPEINTPAQPFDEARPVQPSAAAQGPVLSPQTPRRIGTEPIQDIRQQAEFFVSLGQIDRALEILKVQIAQSPEPNPLVFLDALALHHTLGLKADFRDQRATVAKLFNVAVPDFPAFTLEGNDLDAYPEVLEDLVLLWNSPPVLLFLDQCIIYDPSAQLRPLFDLAAFRSLLLLHTMAEELASGDQFPDMITDDPLPKFDSSPGGFDKPAPIIRPEIAPEPEVPLQSLSVPLDFSQAAPATIASEETTALDDDFLKAFAVDLALLPVAPKLDPEPAPAPVADVQAAFPTPGFPQPGETPSRMLDLDFSDLAAPNTGAPEVSGDTEPIIQPPVRYATRARWPVGKKP